MVDDTLIHTCNRSLDSVVCLCQQPKLNLKNSPPYILDTIPDLYEKLQSILTHYQASLELLNQIDYFQIFIQSLIERCRITIRLFKDAKDKILDPNSVARSRLVKLSLIFSHLLKDLNALFPDNAFDLTNYRLTKLDAANWWSANFRGQSIVPWPVFFHTLCQTFPRISTRYEAQLKQTIDLTCNDHVSIFEFDVFTRLFQPWANIIETWEVLTIYHPGYMAFMTYDEVKAILKKFRQQPGPGTYVFRISCTKPGQWAIGYITEDLRILQTIIQNKSLAQALVDGEREGFYLYPNGKPSPRRLLYQLVHNQSLVHLQVTQEQYQTYYEVGSTFELCKICDENNKDIQLEPCRHLICRNCFLNCQLTGNAQTCPFCRLEIKGIEEVVVDPYKPSLAYHTARSDLATRSPTSNMLPGLASHHDEFSSLCRQTSLPDTKIDLDHDPNLNQTANRSISLDMDSQAGFAQDLIDLIEDCSQRKPPPVPPRNLSASPSRITTVKEVQHDSSGQKSSTIQPGSTKDTGVHVTNLGCPSACLAGSDRLALLSDSDHCQCNSKLPPTLGQSTSHQIHAHWMSHSESSSHNPTPATNRKPDLHYAQLDLIDSDSEMDPQLRSASPSTLGPLDHPEQHCNSTNHHDHYDNSDHYDRQRDHLNRLRHTLPPTDPPPTLDPYDQLAQQPGTDHRDMSPSSSSPPLPTMPMASPFEQNITQLCQLNPDMTRQNALLLLTLTENRLDMSHRIWEHFQPRPERL